MKRSSPLKFLIVVILICSWFIPVFATSAKAAPSSPSGFANGFNEQFTNSASNWYIAQGTWSYGSGKIHGNGLDNDYSEVYFNRANYKNFDYQVNMMDLMVLGKTGRLQVQSSKEDTTYCVLLQSITPTNFISTISWLVRELDLEHTINQVLWV